MERGYFNLWLECDSFLTIQAFGDPSIVPWSLHNRWMNCLAFIKTLNFQVYSEKVGFIESLISVIGVNLVRINGSKVMSYLVP
ncbi:hypothetical protein GYH30_016210 [Glycine max]|uniref:RNase H type-1 domain-containing protein n=1 Tax=Glycine max TaxID=3847 RepID=A0A0R0JTA4_SOYBN|nr:hypothetical protein GYH30_016210 [Glycine max]